MTEQERGTKRGKVDVTQSCSGNHGETKWLRNTKKVQVLR